MKSVKRWNLLYGILPEIIIMSHLPLNSMIPSMTMSIKCGGLWCFLCDEVSDDFNILDFNT